MATATEQVYTRNSYCNLPKWGICGGAPGPHIICCALSTPILYSPACSTTSDTCSELTFRVSSLDSSYGATPCWTQRVRARVCWWNVIFRFVEVSLLFSLSHARADIHVFAACVFGDVARSARSDVHADVIFILYGSVRDTLVCHLSGKIVGSARAFLLPTAAFCRRGMRTRAGAGIKASSAHSRGKENGRFVVGSRCIQ
mmetsp:Transcript_20327/g.29187  ORF Transcript_20327/g.29187 Transcript_20327/m.29187 type:complete len:200 (-) Transcript_20327:939-1538(-)